MSDGQIVGSQGAGVGLPGATTQYGTPPTNSGLWTFAALPPANSLAPGTLVYTTDEGFVYTTGVQWIPISGAGVVISPDGSINVSGLPGNQLSLTVSSEFYGAFNILPGEYSYASLPSAASYFGQIAITTNTNPFIGPVVSNGVSWLPFIFQASGVLQISTGTPAPQGTNGTAYTLTLAVTGAVGNPTWSIVGQFALSGTANTFTLNASTGVLSCADPTNNSTTAIMVQVGTATQTPVQKMITVTVAAALTPAATPTFSPVAGSYVGTQTITISSSTPSATIYYTTNNTTPTTASASIASGGTISITASCTVQAIATASGFGQSAVGSAVYTITASTTFNPIGLNIDAGGSSQLNGTMFPIFTNRIWESNVIQANASFNTPCTLTAAGWPSEDFEVALFSTGSASTQSQPSWAVGGTWFCGFIPSGGTIAIAQGNTYGNCTISNVQTGQGPGSAYTTFSLTVGSTAANPGFGFKVTGTTAGVTNLFAYLPEYATAGANTTTGYFQAVPTCTTEWVSAHNTLRRLRFMDMQNAWYNCGVLLPFTATAAAGATSATLANPFPRATGTYACTFAETGSSGLDAQNITISTSGQTAITFSATAHASTGILIPNTGTSRRTMGNFKIKTSTTGGLANSWASQTCSNEGYPLEMCMTMAIAAGVPEVHVHIPLNEDSSL
jgi:Chitobiase/beta-hexosaminidase C-terminal domain